jgi:pimeloyl-ACP methyl ester carboxylesterase
MLSTEMWDYQVPFLVEHGYRCSARLARTRRSDRPPTGYDVTTLAADLDALTEALDLRNVRLVGHSGGGRPRPSATSPSAAAIAYAT